MGFFLIGGGGVTPLMAQTFTSHLNLRLLDPPPPETNSRYATAEYAKYI